MQVPPRVDIEGGGAFHVRNDGAGNDNLAERWTTHVKGPISTKFGVNDTNIWFTHADLVPGTEKVLPRNCNDSGFDGVFHLRCIINSLYHFGSVKQRADDVARSLLPGGLVVMANLDAVKFSTGLAFAHELNKREDMRVVYYSDRIVLSGHNHLVVVAQKTSENGIFDVDGAAVLPEWKDSFITSSEEGLAKEGVVYSIGPESGIGAYHGSTARAGKGRDAALEERMREHYRSLTKGNHSSVKLQDWFLFNRSKMDDFDAFFAQCRSDKNYTRREN